MRIHTASVGRGIPAFSVHGALTDHHRLIWQFGVAPLMYYLYGENVIIDVGEGSSYGIGRTQSVLFQEPPLGGPGDVRNHEKFSLRS